MNNDFSSLMIFIPMIPESPLISLASGLVSVSTKIHFPGRTFPMHSTSACKHPRTGMLSPFAAVSLTQLADDSFSSCSPKCLLKCDSVIVETSEPVSSKKSVITPAILTSIARQSPKAPSFRVSFASSVHAAVRLLIIDGPELVVDVPAGAFPALVSAIPA